MRLRDRKHPCHVIRHHARHETRRTRTGKPVRIRPSRQTNIVYIGTLKSLRRDPEKNRGTLCRLHEKTVHIIMVEPPQPIGHPARSTADPGGNIDDQRMLAVHRDLLRPQLRRETLGRDSIAEEQIDGLLIIDKVTHGIRIRGTSPLRHRTRVVIRVLDHLHAMRAQEILLPLLRVGRHVDAHMEPDCRTHNADGHTEISRRADLHRIAREEIPQIGDLCIVILPGQEPRIHRQPFCMLQHLIDPAARLHRARNREMAVHLQQETPRNLCSVCIRKPRLHRRNRAQRRLDETIRLRRLRKSAPDKGSKATEPCRRIRNILIRNDQL